MIPSWCLPVSRLVGEIRKPARACGFQWRCDTLPALRSFTECFRNKFVAFVERKSRARERWRFLRLIARCFILRRARAPDQEDNDRITANCVELPHTSCCKSNATISWFRRFLRQRPIFLLKMKTLKFHSVEYLKERLQRKLENALQLSRARASRKLSIVYDNLTMLWIFTSPRSLIYVRFKLILEPSSRL